METRNETRVKFREFAENIVVQADTLDSILDNNPNVTPNGPCDPEDWGMMRCYAKKILWAVNADAYIDPAWLEAIQEISMRHTGTAGVAR
jgi:hypothetical protein